MKNLTKLSPIATVINISEDKQDKNGTTFRTIRVQGLSLVEEVHGGIVMQVKTRGKEVSINQYETSYLDGKPDPFFDAQVGDHVAVEIWRAENLESYEITNPESGEIREVNSYTFGLVRGSGSPEAYLKNQGHRFAGMNSEAVSEKTEETVTNFIED